MSFFGFGRNSLSDALVTKELQACFANSSAKTPILSSDHLADNSIYDIKSTSELRQESSSYIIRPDGRRVPNSVHSIQQTFKEFQGLRNPPRLLLFLKAFDHLLIKRCDDLQMEGVLEAAAKYEILDTNWLDEDEQRVMVVVQRDHEGRKCCNPLYGFPFLMSVLNYEGREIFKLEGDQASRCGEIQSIQVQDNTLRFGEIVRVIRGNSAYIEVHDSSGDPIFEIKNVMPEPGSVLGKGEYMISSMFGEVLIGQITTKWDKTKGDIVSGVFSLRFIKALPVELKALLLGACIVIEYHFFD